MLSISCPITGTSYRLSSFSADTEHKLEVLHPLLLCPLEQLLAIKYPHDSYQQFLLVIAHLWQINATADDELLVWAGKPAVENYSTNWLIQIYPILHKFLIRLHAEKSSTAVKMFPRLRIDAHTSSENIQHWLTACNRLREDYKSILDYDAASIAGKLFAKQVESKHYGEMFPELEDRNPTLRIARNRRNYIERSFVLFPPDKMALIGKVIFRPNDYEVATLKQVKALILDHGLETKIEDFNEKSMIIVKLDQCLADKMNILDALEVSTHKQDLQDLLNIYTVEHNGTSYPNSILVNKLAGMAIQDTSKQVAPNKYYDTMPIRADFTSDFAYKVAVRTFNTQAHR